MIDPAVLDYLPTEPMPWLGEEDPEAEASARERLEELAARVPERLLYLMLPLALQVEGLSQNLIARQLGISQPAVWQRLRRARAALAVAAEVRVSPAEAERWLLGQGEPPQICRIVRVYVETWGQTETGRILGCSQGVVKYCLGKVEARWEGSPVAAALRAIRSGSWGMHHRPLTLGEGRYA